MTRCYVVGNKVRDQADRDFIRSSLPDLPVIGFLSLTEDAVEADKHGQAVFDAAPQLVPAPLNPLSVQPPLPLQ